MALFSIEAEYVTLTLTAKEATWISLLLIELGLLDKKRLYAEIKVLKESKGKEQIKANVVRQEEETSKSTLPNIAFSTLNTPNNGTPLCLLPLTQAPTLMSLKRYN